MSETPRDRLAAYLREDLERAARDEEPLTDEQIEGYVDGTLDDVEREIVESRLADDAALRAEVDALRDLRAVLAAPAPERGRVVAFEPPRRRRPARGWFVPIGIAAAILVGLVLWRRGSGQPSVPHVVHAPPAPPPALPGPAVSSAGAVASLHDGPSTVAIAADGTLRGLDTVPADRRVQIAAALQGGTLPAWPGRARVAGRGGVLMGPAAAGPAFVPIAPRATAVASATPTFRWTALAGATGYRVRVVDEALTTVAESPVVAALAWRPRSPLPRGRVLLWQVEAGTPEGPRTTPAPPLPDARFVVLTTVEAARVDAAVAASRGSDLAAVVIAAEAGLYDDASAALARLMAANPESTRIRALMADLQRRR